MEQYNACLNEFLSNIRLVKSFGTEEEEINKLKNLKNRIERNRNGIGTMIWKIMDFLHDGGAHLLCRIKHNRKKNDFRSINDISKIYR